MRSKEMVYEDLLAHLRGQLRQIQEVTLHLNSLDRQGVVLAGMYLSVPGTSAENADSGEVWRESPRPSDVALAPAGWAGYHGYDHDDRARSPAMKSITASAFKAKCWQLMDDVAATGEPIVMTTHGRPVCQLVPYRTKPRTLYGTLQGSIRITGDLMAPLDVAWEALQ